MIRFIFILILFTAAYPLQAIDKYRTDVDHRGDVFKLADLLSDAGDDRLKNALKQFRENHVELQKVAENLYSADKEILQDSFNPENDFMPTKQQLLLGVAKSKSLIKVADAYEAALSEYEGFVDKVFKELQGERSNPKAMTESFARCRSWADSSRRLAWNVQVYFEHQIDGAIPIKPSKAKELVVLLGESVKLTKEVVANQEIFEAEKKMLDTAIAALDEAKENYDKAKKGNDKAVLDLATQTMNLALSKLAVAEANEESSFLNKRFVVIEELIKSFADDTAAKEGLNKASLALNAATNAFVISTNAVAVAKVNATEAVSVLAAANLDSTAATNSVAAAKDVVAKMEVAFTAADAAAKGAEVNAKKIAGDANKTKEEKDAFKKDAVEKRNAANLAKTAYDKAKAAEQAAVKVALDKTKVAKDARAAEIKVKAAVASAMKAVGKKAEDIERLEKNLSDYKRMAHETNTKLVKAQKVVNEDNASRSHAKPTRSPVPNPNGATKMKGDISRDAELWMLYRKVREQEMRKLYYGGNLSYKLGDLEEKSIMREWQNKSQAQKETYLIERGIVLKPRPTPPSRNQKNQQWLDEEVAKKELDLLKMKIEKVEMAAKEAGKKRVEADRLLVEAMNTLEKVKPVFEAAQTKLKDSSAKEARQRREFESAKSKFDASKSAQGKVEAQIAQNRKSAWASLVSTHKILHDGYVKREAGLKTDPVPFVRD